MRFHHRSQVPAHTSLCERRSFSPSSSEEPVPSWREMFVPFRSCFCHHCSEETFPQRFEQCAAGCVECPLCENQNFYADFVISSTPLPSSLRGPTDTYEGEAHMRKRSAGALQRVAALRLFPFASPFAVLKRIVFALVTMFMSSGSKGGMSSWISRSVSLMSTTSASIPPLAPSIATWVLFSSCSGRDPGR